MIFTPLQSTRIAAIEYRGTTKTLVVMFRRNLAVYEYSNVPRSVWRSMRKACSIGSAHYELIDRHSDKYPKRRLDNE